ncbi:MAG: hypothetical protein JXA72_03710 [Bacteroidales bacterium]|nr:hypothetical protein [Bacteroidales bacterium]
MKTAVSVPYWTSQFHTIQTTEKTFSGNTAPHARLGRTFNQAQLFHTLRVPKFFLISVVRALMLIMMTMIKMLFAILFAVEILFKSAISGIEYKTS